MTNGLSRLNGFLVWRLPSERVRGWPEPVEAHGLAVWFYGYLAAEAGHPTGSHRSRHYENCELVAAAYRRWGTGFGQRLHGEYCAVIADGPTVVAGGDRMGLRPLYFSNSADVIVISSDLGATARELRADSIDEIYIADLLARGRHLGTRTPYSEISRLGIGQAAKWSDATGPKLSVEWRPTIGCATGDLEAQKNRLVRAVDIAVGNSAPEGAVAVHLSGGLDSSTLLACLPPDRDAHAISTVFTEQPTCDEREWIAAALRNNSVPWHPIDVSRCLPFSAGPAFDHFIAAPSYATVTWAQDLAEDEIAREVGATAILTGEGGDEVFSAGALPWHIADLLRTGNWWAAWRQARWWSSDSPAPRPATYWLSRSGFRGWMNWRRGTDLLMRPTAPVSINAPWLAADFVQSENARAGESARSELRALRVDQQAVWEGIVHAAETVRSSYPFTAHRVDTRHPFLSPEMVDVALSTPWQAGVDPRIDRAVQRYAFAGRVSETTLRRRSKATTDLAIFRGLEQASDWIELLWESPEIARRGYVDLARWRESIDRSTVGWLYSVHHFKAAVQIEHWLSQLHRMGRPQLLRVAPP
ncbi:hypothetical protein JDV09_03600 [Mycobacterium sp. Y57]|uniref:asparagine synthase-related protein n=1 Tax=Mycolicibacterium xanthum TaxID=2796469 RepID=UPI001C864B4F|nr:asparagine synthase-related protein [Mycolicibacterium xanthum]MBX7431199.1 hypothetical protein [Mycolicibacterium xanthum]